MSSTRLPSLLPADYCQLELPFASSGDRTEFVWKFDIQLGCKALRLKAEDAAQIHYVQLPKELENRVNDFNNLHNPIFEFLFMRQGRPRPVPLGSWHQIKAYADAMIQSLESQEHD